jgi:hypothetical protein
MRGDELTEIEFRVLESAVAKLNYVYTFGRGESLTPEETMVFNYWKEKGKVRATGPAPFGEIYEIMSDEEEEEAEEEDDGGNQSPLSEE